MYVKAINRHFCKCKLLCVDFLAYVLKCRNCVVICESVQLTLQNLNSEVFPVILALKILKNLNPIK